MIKTKTIKKTERKEECKHNNGWLTIEDVHIFIFKDGKVSFDFQGKSVKSYKLKMRCNNPKCNKVRNVYLSAKVKKWGTIE